MRIAADELKVVTALREHLPRLAEIVEMNDPSLPDLMIADLTRWFDAGRPIGEAYYVALAAKRPIGMVGFRPDPWGVRDIAWLVWLYIDSDWKRLGIARRLFGHAQDVLRGQGIRKVYLDVGNEAKHQPAIAFHRRDGFLLEGHLRDYWKDGEDFMIFGKRL